MADPDPELHEALARHPAWRLQGEELHRDLQFRDFDDALAFLTRVAASAEVFERHPDASIYDQNRVRLLVVNANHAGITSAEVRLLDRVEEALTGAPDPDVSTLPASSVGEDEAREEHGAPATPLGGAGTELAPSDAAAQDTDAAAQDVGDARGAPGAAAGSSVWRSVAVGAGALALGAAIGAVATRAAAQRA